MVTDYYKSLFGTGVGNVFEADSNLWKDDEMATNMENEELAKPFPEEEIKLALFQMKKKTKLQVLIDYLQGFTSSVET
jgi:hypothetical protein